MRKGGWNPARVLAALGKIGYDPVSAVLDIADNSVSAGAERIDVSILVTKRSEGRGRSKAVVDTIVIKDDGRGMNEELLDNALSLGSSEKYYSLGTLSKFGLGLKSAASSLGKRLEIITRMSGEQPLKAILDQEIIGQENDYVYDIDTPITFASNNKLGFVISRIQANPYTKESFVMSEADSVSSIFASWLLKVA